MQPVLCIATGGACLRLLPLGRAEDQASQGAGSLWSAPWSSAQMLDGARIHRLHAQPSAGRSAGGSAQPAEGQKLFAASWGEGLWFSRDGGRRWSNAGVDIQGSRVHCVGASPSGECFVGSEHAILKRAGGDLRRWELLDNLWLVPSSSDWGRQGTAAVRDVAVNPRQEEWLLAAIDGAGVLFSSDGGFSWDDARPNTDPKTHRLLWHPGQPTHALALAPSTLRLSSDGGWSWDDTNFPLGHIQAAQPLPGGQWLVAGSGPASKGSRSEVWRGDGHEWLLATRFEPRKDDAFIESLLVVPEIPDVPTIGHGLGTAWLAGWSDGALETSQDDGRSWRPLLIDGASPARACDLALSAASEEALDGSNEQLSQAEAQPSTQAGTRESTQAKAKAALDERGGARFGLDRKFWSSLLDKGQGRV